MKVAVFSDIHANLPAFQAVLNDMPSVDVMLCAGDLAGYYPDVNEVCNLIRTFGVNTIRGNHDAYVLGEMQPDNQKQNAYRTDWTARHLSPVNLVWLRTLPVCLVFCWDGLTITVRHASPWDEESYLYHDSSGLTGIVAKKKDILVFGHTHHPMQIFAAQGGIILNPGSVGQPRDWDSRSSYAVLDTCTEKIEIRRVIYDVAGMQKRLTDYGWDRNTIDILSRKK